MRSLIKGILYFIIFLLLTGKGAVSQNWAENSNGLEPPEMLSGHTELEFADINMDGNLDILSIGDYGSPYNTTDQHGIIVWFGDGLGNWSSAMTGDFGYGGIAVGDVNNDGFLDVGYGMANNFSSNDFGDQLIEVALGDGTGLNWTPYDDGLATSGENLGMFGTDFADVDADGLLDIVSISFGSFNGLHVYRNNGNGTWSHSFGFLGGQSNLYIEFGDINRDGFPDIASCNSNQGIYINDGFGYHTPLVGGGITPPGYLGYEDVALGDIDHDGADEVGIIAPNWKMGVWKLNSNGTTWTDLSYNLRDPVDVAMIDIADINADGDLDVIGYGRGHIYIYAGDGGFTWTLLDTLVAPATGIAKGFRAGADVDHNGFGDIIILNNENTNPGTINYLHFYKETSIPSVLTIVPEYPHGNEKLHGGAAGWIEWKSAVPAGGGTIVDIEFSSTGPAGPYMLLAGATPNVGRYQVNWPDNINSTQCHIRLTAHRSSGDISTATTDAFEIDSVDPEPISINMIPHNPPVIVPRGGSFTFTGVLVNNSASSRSTDVWIMLNVPGYGIYGPLMRVNNVPLAPRQTLTVPNVAQSIPMIAPLGVYNYIAYCGDYPSILLDSAAFQFTVIQNTSIENGANDWKISGWFDNGPAEIPALADMLSIQPNPFNSSATIGYIISGNEASRVKLDIFNLLGQRVETLVDEIKTPGAYSANWDAAHFTTGVYLCRLQLGNSQQIRRITLIK